MGELINGRTPKAIKIGLRNMLEACGEICGEDTRCLYDICPYYGDKGCNESIQMDAIAYIQYLEAQQPKWISVEERLPEHRQHVYACAKDKFRFEGIYIDPVGFERYEIGEGWVNENRNVTHWMPLPQPPKEKDA